MHYTIMSFGTRLATIRKERKVSQSDLSAKAGIHINVVGRYEREEAVPSIEVAAKIAEALKVSLDYLVLGKSDPTLDQALLEKVLSIQQLPDEDKEHIMYSIDGLIQHAKTRMAYKK
jgi:transcriptional regulator with XRE-family HTH domain